MVQLRIKARAKVKLLKERELVICDEAEKLLEGIEDGETDHLYRRIIR